MHAHPRPCCRGVCRCGASSSPATLRQLTTYYVVMHQAPVNCLEQQVPPLGGCSFGHRTSRERRSPMHRLAESGKLEGLPTSRTYGIRAAVRCSGRKRLWSAGESVDGALIGRVSVAQHLPVLRLPEANQCSPSLFPVATGRPPARHVPSKPSELGRRNTSRGVQRSVGGGVPRMLRVGFDMMFISNRWSEQSSTFFFNRCLLFLVLASATCQHQP